MAIWYFDDLDNLFFDPDPSSWIYGGTAANDTMYGYGGNDYLRGSTGNDIIFGGKGNDTLFGDEDDDLLEGESGHDNLQGGTGNDKLIGGSGHDILAGDTGADLLIGGTGNDEYWLTDSFDTIVESTSSIGGLDTAIVYFSGYTLEKGVEILRLRADAFYGYGNSGKNSIYGDDPTIGYALFGNGGNDSLYGNNESDGLHGGSGNDKLDGGAGGDSLYGGSGNDTYYVDNALDYVSEQNFTTGGDAGGTDTVISSVTFHLGDTSGQVENLTLTGMAHLAGYGNHYKNLIKGNDGDNTLDGGDGNDTLYGGAGVDTLFGTFGENKMYGGVGNDTFHVNSKGDKVIEYKTEGWDGVYSNINYTLPAHVEGLTLEGGATVGNGNNLLNLIVSENINDSRLYGKGGNDLLYGNDGNDLLDGGTGSDIMTGGDGDDTYIVNTDGETVLENPDEGYDTVKSSASFTLGSNVENLILTGTKTINGTGNALSNNLTGNASKNTLWGFDGNDELYGKGGNDILYGGNSWDILDGGAGADKMYGGSGDDSYYVNSKSDLVSEDNGSGGNAGGFDSVHSSVSFVLPEYVENLMLSDSTGINGTGNSLSNALFGNNGNNKLKGLGGDDNLAGSGGKDTLIGGDGGDHLYGGSGNDLLYGNDGADNLYGDSGNDRLYGNNGDDCLKGGAGADKMNGGSGSDEYFVDSVKDVVVDVDEVEFDSIVSTVSYTLPQYVEDLYLFSDGSINATGNKENNFIAGSDGDNVLKGSSNADFYADLGGSDWLFGGTGDDTYWVNSGDVILEIDYTRNYDGSPDFLSPTMPGGGNDTVVTILTSYTLAADLENLTLLTEGSLGTGNTAANKMSAKEGSTLQGLGGDDHYTIYGSVTINENVGEGDDSVTSFYNNYTLASNIENLFLGGSIKNGTGNALDNQLFGNAANNQLNGGAGNDSINGGKGIDTMTGGIGNDTYFVDTSNDKIIELNAEGLDNVYSKASYRLSDNVENLYLTGTNNISGIGNELGNSIHGNSKANKLSGLGGSDAMYGEGGNDILIGGDEYDILYGGDGNDKLQGGDIFDDLHGGAGKDTLTGGDGGDWFYFETDLNATSNVDTITDFSSAEGDRIRLYDDVFTSLTGGTLTSDNFFASSTTTVAAQDSDDYILYSKASGALLYDADGNGGGSDPIKFATLTGSPDDLSASDFFVVG